MTLSIDNTRTDAYDKKRRAIVTLAAKVFDTEGYHTTNVEELARAAGLKKPSLYHYFASKDEILYAIHEEFIDVLAEAQEARAMAGSSPSESLRAIMTDVLRLMDTHRGHVRVFFENHRELSPKHRVTIAAKRDRYAEAVEAEVRRGIEVGEFRDVDPRVTTLALFGMCNWAYQWYRADSPLSSCDVAEFFWEILIEGMRLRPS